MRTSYVCKLRQTVSLTAISLMLCALFVGFFPGVAYASSEKGTLALDPQTIEVEKDNETLACPDWPFFNVNVTVSNVTDLSGVVVSVHWNASLLNCTMLDGVTEGFAPGDFLPEGLPDATGYMIIWDFAAGNMSEAANSMLSGEILRTVPEGEWRWVMTLTFEYIGPSPAIGEPIETDIIIANQPDYAMSTGWCESWDWDLYHDFEPYPEPVPDKPWIISTCRFHYEAVTETLTHTVEGFNVVTFSNSIVSNMNLSIALMELSFNVTGPEGVTGFCNVTIPKALLRDSPWTIKIDDTPITDFIPAENTTHSFLYFTYTHASSRQVTIRGTWVVPEFPAFMIPLLLVIATIAAAIASRKVRSIRRRGYIIVE